MAKCTQQGLCPFFRGKIPIHDAMFKTNVTRYCEGDSANCAIFQVIKAVGFLKVPPDLYPNQVFRVKDILAK